MPPASQKINLKDKVEDGEIDLSMSDLQDVPVKEIASIRKAHSLDLSNNHIATLPKNFSTLSHLIILDLSKNELKELPDNFGELSKLKHLDLYKNQLQHLPLSFSKLKALKWLDLKDNPLVPAIAKVAGPCLESKQCQNCAKAIISFYTQLEIEIEGEKRLREEHRQKSIQGNLLKQKQDKKIKKKEKKSQRDNEPLQPLKKPNASTNQKVDNHKTKSTKEPLPFIFRLFKFFAVLFTLLGLTLFIGTAAKVNCFAFIEDGAIELFEKGIAELPPNLKPYAMEGGKHIVTVHDYTGQLITTITNSEAVNLIYTEAIGVFKNATLSATNFYTKLFVN